MLNLEPTIFPSKEKTQTYAWVLIVKLDEDEDTNLEEVGCGHQKESQPELTQIINICVYFAQVAQNAIT